MLTASHNANAQATAAERSTRPIVRFAATRVCGFGTSVRLGVFGERVAGERDLAGMARKPAGKPVEPGNKPMITLRRACGRSMLKPD